MSALFEMISPSVWQHLLVNDVHLPNRPDVETAFGEHGLKQRMVAHLYIAAAETDPLDKGFVRQGPVIAVMRYPRDRRNVAIHIIESFDLALGNLTLRDCID